MERVKFEVRFSIYNRLLWLIANFVIFCNHCVVTYYTSFNNFNSCSTDRTLDRTNHFLQCQPLTISPYLPLRGQWLVRHPYALRLCLLMMRQWSQRRKPSAYYWKDLRDLIIGSPWMAHQQQLLLLMMMVCKDFKYYAYYVFYNLQLLFLVSTK